MACIKLEQSDWREVMGRRPSRVPVTARAQLSALHPLVRSLMRPAMAAATKDRTTAAFMFAVSGLVSREDGCCDELEVGRHGNTEKSNDNGLSETTGLYKQAKSADTGVEEARASDSWTGPSWTPDQGRDECPFHESLQTLTVRPAEAEAHGLPARLAAVLGSQTLKGPCPPSIRAEDSGMRRRWRAVRQAV